MLNHLRDALCVILGSRAHTMTAMAASVGSALLYGIVSISMAIINKIVLYVYGFNYPTLIMTMQMAVSFFIVRAVDALGYIHLAPLTVDNLRKFLAPCFFYSLNGVLSLAALGSMNLTMYSLLKRNGPLVTMLLTAVCLRKALPGRFVMISVLMMSLGCIIAANGDLTFDLEAYTFGGGSVLSQSLYLILLQRLSDNYSTSDTLYMNSVLSFPVLVVMSGLFGEYTAALKYDRYRELGFILFICLLLVMGSFLNFTLFLCNSNNSALTTSVVGTIKSVAQTTMGMFTFGGVAINPSMITGVTINLTGGILYTYAKYLDSEKKKEMKKVQSNTGLDVESGKLLNNNHHGETALADNLTHIHTTKPTQGQEEKTL